MTTAKRFLDGRTTVVRGQTQAVGLITRLRLPKGVGRSKNSLMRATSPTGEESIGMMTFIKPLRTKKPGRTGTSSNSGFEAE